MSAVPAPSLVDREEWPDADFDLPEGQPLHAVGDKDDDDEDWDVEMDLGKTGGAKALSVSPEPTPTQIPAQMFHIRPPAALDDFNDEDDDEGVSTIKVAAFVKSSVKPQQTPIDEDFEDAFSLPSDLTQLSLAPLSLNHRLSKSSLEWGGDKDHTSSSQSSDAYSSLGFADASPSSNSTSSASQPDTEAEDDDEDEGDLEGLVIPSGLFESGQGTRHLTKILEMKRTAMMVDNQVKVASPDPEDDFEMGLVIDDDVDFSPSRLLTQQTQSTTQRRSNTVPPQRLRPPSRLKPERAKSPVNPPTSSMRQLQKLRLSPSPPPRPTSRGQTFSALTSAPSSATSFLSPKPASLRGQKSHTGLKPQPEARRLPRKASLSSLMESSQSQASGSGTGSSESNSKAGYDQPTAASRAKSHKTSLGRMDYKVPPTRPSTPSNNPAALRLTMPTQSRLKSRPTLSSVGWNPPMTPSAPSPSFRTSSPLPPRPPSSLSLRATRSQTAPTPAVPRLLRKPKRQRLFGDGTELDGIDDLPTDRDKESRFRVQPKGYGNRIPGGSYPSKSSERGTIRRKGKREVSFSNSDTVNTLLSSTNVSTRPHRTDTSPKKKKSATSSSGHTRRKPTLIRNLGGAGTARVVGDMKWNPHTLRWEGNEQVLRDFDVVVTSTRPALITHLTGSSIGSPVASFASGARIVGNMMFDPKRMCWLSTLPPDEDEPDVFANLADDEEDGDGWESKGGTVRASLQSLASENGSSTSSALTFNATVEAPSPARSLTSECGSDRGSRASMVYDVDDTFIQRCRIAEERHRLEMRGWRTTQDVFAEPNRSYLYEIRAVATRSYSTS